MVKLYCCLSRTWLNALFSAFVVCSLFYYFLFLSDKYEESNINTVIHKFKSQRHHEFLDLWLIFTRVNNESPLKYRFSNLLTNLLNISSVPLNFHIIVDNLSKKIAITELSKVSLKTNKSVTHTFYNVTTCATAIEDIVSVMTPHFSSKPGTYYSDALFYLSLGLHRIAPTHQKVAAMLDCDVHFKEDVVILFEQLKNFTPTNLFGLAPELTPVYRHVLHTYRSKHNTTKFGGYRPFGFQGYNSGVILFNLSAMRSSEFYNKIVLSPETVATLTEKYSFRGHLGDQDFFTLIGYEYPQLVHDLDCGFNRQLCVWWRDHGYKEVFQYYFRCKRKKIFILHGNCNTVIP